MGTSKIRNQQSEDHMKEVNTSLISSALKIPPVHSVSIENPITEKFNNLSSLHPSLHERFCHKSGFSVTIRFYICIR